MTPPILTSKEQAKYNSKAKDSFRTQYRLYLFSCVINQNTPNLGGFKQFKITDDLIDSYAADYWQQAPEEQLNGYKVTVKEIYSKLKVLESKSCEEFESYYLNYFGTLFPRQDFMEIISRKNCCYCKVSIDNIEQISSKGRIYKKNLRGWNLEVERFNSNKEYFKDNCDMACYWCNNAKTDEFTPEEFAPIGKEIAKIWAKRLE